MFDCDKQVNRILEILERIECNKFNILVGTNGSGKSLIRKQMPFRVKRVFDNVDIQHCVTNVSMQLRTESNVDFGALSTVFHDTSWTPTSVSTYDLIKGLFSNIERENKKKFIVIDEPEIGMSRESQLGIALYIKDKYNWLIENTLGVLIITHSEIIVDTLKDISVFHNLNDDNGVEEWLNRTIVPTDFEELSFNSNELFNRIEERSKKKKAERQV